MIKSKIYVNNFIKKITSLPEIRVTIQRLDIIDFHIDKEKGKKFILL